MYIQPSVQSASFGATFASSVSATGVEQTVSRAPLPPVDAASRGSAAQNRENPYLATTSQAAGQNVPAQASATATGTSQFPDPGEEDAGNTIGTTRTDTSGAALQRQQEEADQALLTQLRARDREVRLHEAAHAAIGGRYAGAATFQYRRGPDGRNYAVGGEVGISTGPVPGNLQATIEKARTIRAAALAPAEPSAQDRQVAAEAAQLELDARTELQRQEIEARAAAEESRAQSIEDKQAEETRKNKKEEEEKRTEEEATAESAEAARNEAAQSEAAPVGPPARQARDSGNDSNTKDDEPKSEEEPRPDARERLEQILLGSRGILVDANLQGLVDPLNPYGKSGFLDIFA